MTFARLLLSTLRHQWRGNLAVLLGVAVGTAVLAGALLVGDSLRGSLRERIRQQFGWVGSALIGGRFFRQSLADDLASPRVVPAVVLRGTAQAGKPSDDSFVQAGGVNVYGVPASFWGDAPPGGAEFWKSGPLEGDVAAKVVVSRPLADRLKLAAGGSFRLQLQKLAAVPRESVLGRPGAADTGNSLTLAVESVLPAGAFGEVFALNPGPGEPLNVFVPLAQLQRAIGQDGQANALLTDAETRPLQERLEAAMTLDDLGLMVTTPDQRADRAYDRAGIKEGRKLTPAQREAIGTAIVARADADGDDRLTRDELRAWYRGRPYLELGSRQLLFSATQLDAAHAAASPAGLRHADTLVYLVNDIADGEKAVPYSIVAALDAGQAAPLGPFLPPDVPALQSGEIVLADWKQSPLKPKVGDRLTLKFFRPEIEGRLETGEELFAFRGLVPLDGPALDPDLTPEVPGFTDKATMKDWKSTVLFPIDTDRITPADEEYWKAYRGTPKAYVSLADGQRLWGSSRFGKVTTIRLAPMTAGADPNAAVESYKRELRSRVDPVAEGFVFRDLREAARRAGEGSTDFGMYFLGFSFFLIAAAVLLVGLLVRLNLDRRADQLGLLLAVGWPRSAVWRLLAAEGLAVAAVGGLVGLGGAVLYAAFLIRVVGWLWPPGGGVASFLALHVTPVSLATGYVAGLGVSGGVILWAVRGLSAVPPRALLAGETGTSASAVAGARWAWLVFAVALVGALVLTVAGFFVGDPMARAGTFFGGGALTLTALLAGLWGWLRARRHAAVRGRGPMALARLGARNATRNPLRSVLTAGLLASAAFVLVAAEAFRPSVADASRKDSGTGGFPLVATTDLPVFQNLDTPEGMEEVTLGLNSLYRDNPMPFDPTGSKRTEEAEKALEGVRFYPSRVRAGDDASCLNLFNVTRPKLLSVSPGFVERGGFTFASLDESLKPTAEERANPWRLLARELPDGQVPVIGDATSLMYILKKSVGGTVDVTDEAGRPVTLRIVAALSNSLFQSELVLSERQFLRLYPRQEGYGLFLIDVPAGRDAADVSRVLEAGLATHGFDAEPAAARLAGFLAVESTWLSTFQLLGGLGLLLGALGLAVVLLRSVWERRAELALLRAVGYRVRTLGLLVLAENVFLLTAGLGVGLAAAAMAVSPHLAETGGIWTALRLAGLLAAALAVGLAAGLGAVNATLNAPLIPALRKE